MKSVIAEGMHYIRSADGIEEFFNLRSDAEERFNLAAQPDAQESLRRLREGLLRLLKRR